MLHHHGPQKAVVAVPIPLDVSSSTRQHFGCPLDTFQKFELTTVPLQCEIVSNAIKLTQILINPLTNPMLYLLMHTWRCFLAYGASIVDVLLDSARYPTNGCKLTKQTSNCKSKPFYMGWPLPQQATLRVRATYGV